MASQSATNVGPMMPSGSADLGRFIGGRSRWNTRRRALADGRRIELIQLLRTTNIGCRGWKSELARQLGVDRSTIGRDIREIGRLRARLIADEAEQRADDQEDLQMQMAIALRQSGFVGAIDGNDDDLGAIAEDQHR